jgi:hypothetical protein
VRSSLIRPDGIVDFDITDHPGAYGRIVPIDGAAAR